MRSICLLMVFGLLCRIGTAQKPTTTTFSGKITDEIEQVVTGANVLVYPLGKPAMIAFAISKNDGSYSLKFDTGADSVRLEITHISYKKVSKIISTKVKKMDFVLEGEVKMLDAIVIKKPNAIEQRGDTLVFNVGEFQSQKDRAIADVIRKLPGIEVEANGRILYQGKPIQKYYIEGLDLLEGKYNLANDNLPADAVEEVEILQNHQPIRALDSLEGSDRASINIKLKNKVTFTGTAELGAGLSPALWKANVTPMFFGKKQQSIVSLQSNNIGEDISRQLNQLTLENYIERLENPERDIEWLQIQRLSRPPFPTTRWMDNRSHLGSINHLIKLKNDYQLKVNLSYLHDNQRQIGTTTTQIFSPEQTIRLFEQTNNEWTNRDLQGKLIWTKNTQNKYLKNTLEIKNERNTALGQLSGSNGNILQEIDNPILQVSNRLKWIIPTDKNAYHLTSTFNYRENTPSLFVDSLLYPSLVAIDSTMQTIRQQVTHRNIGTHQGISFTKKVLKVIALTPKLSVLWKRDVFDSHLLGQSRENGLLQTKKVLDSTFLNDLTFTTTKIGAELKAVYNRKGWRVSLQTPFNWRYFVLNRSSSEEELFRPTFEPKMRISKDWNAAWKTTLNIEKSNTFGEINQLYDGFLLTNYRNLRRNNAPLQEASQYKIQSGFSYKHLLKSWFVSTYYTYQYRLNNLVYDNLFLPNATTILEAQERDNISQKHSVNTTITKYFSSIRTTVSLKPSAFLSYQEVLNNGVFALSENQNLNFSTKINSDLKDWISLTYRNRFSLSSIYFDDKFLNKFYQQEHQVELYLYPDEQQYVSIVFDYFRNTFGQENTSSQFIDLSYQYSIDEKNIDLSINLMNVLGTDVFADASNSPLFFTESSFQLRPRQILASIKFQIK